MDSELVTELAHGLYRLHAPHRPPASSTATTSSVRAFQARHLQPHPLGLDPLDPFGPFGPLEARRDLLDPLDPLEARRIPHKLDHLQLGGRSYQLP